MVIAPGKNGTDTGGRIPPGDNFNCQIKIPSGGATVSVRIIHIYIVCRLVNLGIITSWYFVSSIDLSQITDHFFAGLLFAWVNATSLCSQFAGTILGGRLRVCVRACVCVPKLYNFFKLYFEEVPGSSISISSIINSSSSNSSITNFVAYNHTLLRSKIYIITKYFLKIRLF